MVNYHLDVTTLDEIEDRQADLLIQLEELNRRVEKTLSLWVTHQKAGITPQSS